MDDMSPGKRLLCWGLLSALLVCTLVNTLVWLQRDTRPPRWDEASYMATSLRHYEALTTEGLVTLVQSFLTLDRIRPPLVPALAVPAYLLFGRGAETALVVNLVALAGAILAVYGIGRRLVSPWCGLLAAFMVAMYPGVSSLSRLFLLEVCDMALVAYTLYALIRTKGFSHTTYSLAFGISAGFGLLCRAFFPVFLLGPVAVSLATAWRAGRHRHQEPGMPRPTWPRNARLALLMCALVAAPWYVLHMAPLVLRSLIAAYGAEAVGYGPEQPLTLQAITSYGISFINVHTAPYGMLLFLLALACLWWPRAPGLCTRDTAPAAPGSRLLLLLSSMVIPGVFFTTLPSQDIKNILPVLPGMALITAWGLTVLPPRRLRHSLILGSVCWSLVQYWLGSYGYAGLPQQLEVSLGGQLPPLLLTQQGLTYPPGETPFLPRREHWPIPAILTRMTGGTVESGTTTMLRPALVAILPDHPHLNVSTFDYVARVHRLPLQFERCGDPRLPDGPHYRVPLLGVDFVVTKTGDAGPQWLNVYNEEILAFLRTPESGFVEIAPRFPWPDGSEVILYARAQPPVLHALPPVQHSVSVRFDNQIELLGYNVQDVGHTHRGRAFLLVYYWQALRAVAQDYHLVVQVTRAPGSAVIRQWNHAPARGRYPTSWWQPGTIIEDRGLYFLPETAPAGAYHLWLGVSLPISGDRLTVTQAMSGRPLEHTTTSVATATIHLP